MELKIDARMFQAMRLTRQGRLTEATEVIQTLLGFDRKTTDRSSEAQSRSSTIQSPLVIDGTAERIEYRPEQPPRDNASAGPPTPSAPASAPKRPGVANGNEPLGAKVLPRFARAARQRPSASVYVPTGAQFIAGNYRGDAGAREYKVYVPSRYSGASVPLVVMLHGCTQSADDFATGTQMNALAEEQGFLVVYPIQAKSANSSGCWNWFNGVDQLRGSGEPAIIAGITRSIANDYAIDPERIYVAGLSAGGATAAIMGAAYPEIYAAVGVHSGLPVGAATDLPTAFAAMRKGARGAVATSDKAVTVPTIVFHGAQDKTVHPSNAELIVEQGFSRQRANLRTETTLGQSLTGRSYERICKLDADGRTVAEMWRVDGMGHAWSGGHGAGSFTDPDGPPASREMVRFFLQHRRTNIARGFRGMETRK